MQEPADEFDSENLIVNSPPVVRIKDAIDRAAAQCEQIHIVVIVIVVVDSEYQIFLTHSSIEVAY